MIRVNASINLSFLDESLAPAESGILDKLGTSFLGDECKL